jgi:hypothetical protein
MPSRITVMPENLGWKRAYMAAICEKDRECALELIEDAKSKLSARFRELTKQGFVLCDEAEAIHDAFYMLQALQSSLPYRDELD